MLRLGDTRDEEESYSSFQNYLSCAAVQDIEYEYRCSYVRNNTECQDEVYFFNYVEIVYCYLKPTGDRELYALMMIFMVIAFVFFWILGAIAKIYFCPALLVLSNVLNLSEHVAGITILAIGNGSPDLFKSIAKLNNDPITLFSSALSGAIFVLAFVGGIVCLIHPFHASCNGTMRDTTFLLLGTLCVNLTMNAKNYITLRMAIGFFSIYLFYILVIITDLYLIKQRITSLEKKTSKGAASFSELKRYKDLKEQAEFDILSQDASSILINIETIRRSTSSGDNDPNENLIKQLFISLNPFNEERWSNAGVYRKISICIAAPITLLLTFLIPRVNCRKDICGWSKLLNCIQVVTLPLFSVFSLCSFFRLKPWFGIPICFYTLIFTVPLAYYVFKSTRTDSAPSFHTGFALLAIYGSIFSIYSFTVEVMAILNLVGMAMNTSRSFMGCTVLTWATGIGDLVSNTYLAFHGYQKMAFAACIGGPFFSTIVCLGWVLVYKTMASENNRINLIGGPMGTNCVVYLLILLTTTLFWSATTNFHSRRSIGIFYLMIYFLFFFNSILCEWDVVQTYAEKEDYGFDE